jgi:actin-like ATPase involved in cell morphogenesis
MARVVEWVVAQVSATEGSAPASLALTHPANWGEYKLDLLRQGLRHVGLTVERFVPEPVAAATAYATQRSLAPGAVVAVYDLGGGTFDAALVRAGSGAGPGAGMGAQIIGRPDGIERLGGIDFDHAVFRHVLAATGLDLDRLDADDLRTSAALAQLREECVEAKEALSHETDVSVPVMLPQRHTEVRLTRAEFETMIRPALEETLVALRRAVASASMAVEDVDAVLLVGGSSRIPLVGQLVATELGRPIAVDARPKDAICLGAALVAMSAAGPAAPRAAGHPVPPASGGPLGQPVPAANPGPSTSPAGAAPAPGSTPPGGWPAPPAPHTGSATRRRALLAAITVVVLLAGVLGAVLLTDDQPQASGDGGRTATTESDPGGDDRDDNGSTATTAVDDALGGLDPGDLGGLGGDSDVQLDPLPGSDWSEEARVQFVDDCATHLGADMSAVGADPADMCGCIYDDVSATSDFAAFNEQWTGEVDPGSEVGQNLTNAVFSCSLAASG